MMETATPWVAEPQPGDKDLFHQIKGNILGSTDCTALDTLKRLSSLRRWAAVDYVWQPVVATLVQTSISCSRSDVRKRATIATVHQVLEAICQQYAG